MEWMDGNVAHDFQTGEMTLYISVIIMLLFESLNLLC